MSSQSYDHEVPRNNQSANPRKILHGLRPKEAIVRPSFVTYMDEIGYPRVECPKRGEINKGHPTSPHYHVAI